MAYSNMKLSTKVISAKVICLLLLMLAPLCVCSCGGEDDDEPEITTLDKALIGEWKYSYSDEVEEGTFGFDVIYTFKSDGTCRQDWYENLNGEETMHDVLLGRWSTANHILTIETIEDGKVVDVETLEYVVTGNKLSLEGLILTRN